MRKFWNRSSLLAFVAATLLVGGCATQEELTAVRSTADHAATTADEAKMTADHALMTAQMASATAQAALHHADPHTVASYEQARASRICVRWSSSTGKCVQTAYRASIRAQRYTADWIAGCARRYRSFNPASGTYLGYDGIRHECVL